MSRRSGTPEALVSATAALMTTRGLPALTARTIAAEAGVNQALVFYHFNTVTELIRLTSQRLTEAAVSDFATRFAAVTSLGDLLEVGRDIHTQAAEDGHVRFLAQMLAAGQDDAELAAIARDMLGLWIAEITRTAQRVLDSSVLGDIVDASDLAPAIAGGFIGIELYAGVDDSGADAAFRALEQLGTLAAILDDLGPVERALVTSRLRKHRA